MKKKILSILISVFAICTFMFTLSACGGGEPPHTHTFNKEVATSDYLSTNATCDKEAEYFYSCECGVKGTETFKKGSALGHAYGDWISNGNNTHSKICSNNNTHIITEDCSGGTATCQEKASCSVCGEKYGIIGSHQPKTEWVTTETHHYHECKTSGCTEKLNHAEHNFDSNKKCSGCDYVTTALLGTEIYSNVYEIDGTNLFVKVPNTQTNFSFAKTINVASGATYKVYTDISCKEEYCIPSYVVNDLKEENNVYYFLVSNGDEIPQVYTVTVRRRPKYTVTFNTDGGSYVAPQTIEEDALATAPTTTKTGYSFDIWDYDFNTAITDNITITASWNINQYTITFVLNNSKENIVVKQNYNTSVIAPVPTKIGHTFSAWDKSVPSKMPAEDVTINATWKINQYTLTIVYNNGQENKVIKQDYNTEIEKITAPEKTGYIFAGWDKELPVKMPAEDVIITAIWKESTKTPYRVEYYLENLENDNYSILSSATENLTGTTNSTVYADIKTFEHFTAEKTSVSGVVAANGTTVLKVYYQRDEYTVTFDGNGGTLISGDEVQTVKYGGSVVAPTYTKEGYTFKPFDKENLANINNSFTAFAAWDINQYKLTLIFDNGEKNETITKDFNSYINVVNPQRVGYTFDGWDKAMPIRMPAEDVTIKAKWLAIFSLSNNEIVGLTDHGKTLKEIIIPSEIDSAKIMSIGKQAFEGCEKLTSVVLSEGVTTIGEKAFYNCKALTNIEIPASIISIEEYAFFYSSLLKDVNYLGAVEQWCQIKFSNSSANPLYYANKLYIANRLLKEIVLNVETISAFAFYRYGGLEKVVIGNNVKTIEESAFFGSGDISNFELVFELNSKLTNIGANAFTSCEMEELIIPNNVIDIGAEAFSSCRCLEKVSIPASVLRMGADAFARSKKIKNIQVDEKNTKYKSIDGNLYNKEGTTLIQYASGKTETTFTIPNGVLNINTLAVWYAGSLTTITIPESVTNIDIEAMQYCSNLKNIQVDEKNTKYKSIDGNLYNKEGTTLIQYASGKTDEDFNIPVGVIEIGVEAFLSNDNLVNVVLPDSVQIIRAGAFRFCDTLESITLGKGLKIIEEEAFYECEALISVVFAKESVLESIGGNAFDNCKMLKNIIIPSSVLTIDLFAFNSCENLEIYCESGSKPSGWYSGLWNSDNRPVYWFVENQEDVPTDGGNYWHYDENGNPAIW